MAVGCIVEQFTPMQLVPFVSVTLAGDGDVTGMGVNVGVVGGRVVNLPVVGESVTGITNLMRLSAQLEQSVSNGPVQPKHCG